ALEQLKSSTLRLQRVVGLIRGRGLSERAAEYVLRAVRLYVWGFEQECAIMCRSALEAALLVRLDDCVNLDTAPPDLDQLIKVAGEKDILQGYELAPHSKKGWRARRETPLWRAQRVQRTGNR